MCDNYDGPQMAQTIIRLQAQLDARRRIGKYVSFRLVGDEDANPQDAADKVMKLIDEIETIAVNDKSGCLRCTEIVNLIHWTLRSDEAKPTMLDLTPVGPGKTVSDVLTDCWCHKCNEGRFLHGVAWSSAVMILCPDCGNKRCPHASDHELSCTGSNEPGQPGSVYA